MEDATWSQVEGMVIAPDLDPRQLAEFLQSRRLLAQLEWYDETPELVGVHLAMSDDLLAQFDDDETVSPGPKLLDFAQELASQFQAEVMIGYAQVDEIPGDHADLMENFTHEGAEVPLRVVEIGKTPASAVPLMAALEGVDVAELELPEGKRLLAAQLSAGTSTWYFGDVPLVTLTQQGDEFQAFYTPDDHIEHVVSYNWGMNELIVQGSRGTGGALSQVASELVGSRRDVTQIHDAVPGANADAAFEATQVRGPLATRRFVAALGLPEDIADFLLGVREIDQIRGASVHQARGISSAIGRSVDILIDEKQEESEIWGTYTRVVKKNTWLVPAAAIAQSALGVGLIAISRPKDGRRSAPAKLGVFAGVALLVGAAIDVAMAKVVVGKEDSTTSQGAPLTEDAQDL